MSTSGHIEKTLSTSVPIAAPAEIIWKHITHVQIEEFSDPWYFSLLDIPKPLSAEITKEEVGGKRIAYFANGKRFIQEITTWDQQATYSFTFNPDKNFRAGYFFDLNDGPFRMVRGSYRFNSSAADNSSDTTKLLLASTYRIAKGKKWLLQWPVYVVLRLFQRYLLRSIKKNAEADVN